MGKTIIVPKDCILFVLGQSRSPFDNGSCDYNSERVQGANQRAGHVEIRACGVGHVAAFPHRAKKAK